MTRDETDDDDAEGDSEECRTVFAVMSSIPLLRLLLLIAVVVLGVALAVDM